MPIRDVLKLIYKGLMTLVTVVLAGGAILAYWSSTPGNGLLLVSGILAVLALIALLSIGNLDRRDYQADTYREIADDMLARFPVQFRFGKSASRPGNAATFGTMEWTAEEGAPVSVHFAEPEVHRMDQAMLDEARRMAAEGAPIDEICRMVDPEHDRHDPAHQEVFRRIVRAAIEQG